MELESQKVGDGEMWIWFSQVRDVHTNLFARRSRCTDYCFSLAFCGFCEAIFMFNSLHTDDEHCEYFFFPFDSVVNNLCCFSLFPNLFFFFNYLTLNHSFTPFESPKTSCFSPLDCK